MITLYSTIFMESYAHFKVMLTALPWGNLFGLEEASVSLVVLVFTLPEPYLIYVAAFSFYSNFQPDFSKLSVDFMNFCHLTPCWPSEAGELEQPEWVFWLGLHYNTWKRTEKLIWTTTILFFVEQMEAVLINLCTQWTFSFQLMPLVKVVNRILCSKDLCVCNKGCQNTRGTESKGSKKAKNLDTAKVGIAMWPMKNCQRSDFGTELARKVRKR